MENAPVSAPPRRNPPTDPASLLPVLGFVCLGSLGTGAVMSGVAFLAESAYGFDRSASFFLVMVLGLSYVPGALGVGPALRRIGRHSEILTPRRSAMTCAALLGLCASLPWAASKIGLPDGPWPIWVIAVVYSAVSGAMWPVMESYLSGARRGRSLRRAVGAFNIVWTSSVFLSFWLMGPFIERDPLGVLLALGIVHLLSAAVLTRLDHHPARHLDDEPSDDAPGLVPQLAVARLLLPLSYVLMSALNAYWPHAIDALELAPQWHTPFVATWMAVRVLTMITLERWHAWHGRWLTLHFGAGALFVGFAGCVLIPPMAGVVLSPPAATAALVAFLSVLGVGFGVTYTAALTYVLDVGNASVDAGGSHEALIGVGYTLGPLMGLAASSAENRGLIPDGTFEQVFLGLAGAVCAGVGVWAAVAAIRAERESKSPSRGEATAADTTGSR